MAIRKLPNELLSMIHFQLLNDLDITTVEEFDDSRMNPDELPTRIPTSYVLDPATLSLMKYYSDELFASTLKWRNPTWEHHVRFVFPSALEMADVLATYRTTGRLDQIRNIKVFDRSFVTRGHVVGHRTCCYVATLLNLCSDLKLDRLEWEYRHPVLDEFPSQHNLSGLSVRFHLVAILASPGWKKLSIFIPKHHFDQQGVDLLIQEFDKVAQADRTDQYTFELPCTPTIKDASGRITGLDTDKRPTPVKRFCWDIDYFKELINVSIPSWLGGTAVCNEIAIRRARYGVRVSHSPVRDPTDLMREWTVGDGEVWKKLRNDELVTGWSEW